MLTIVPDPQQIEKMSPMMRQYYELKKRSLDAVLFFRMGDFYEVFAEDAVLIAPILGLTLTSRERGDAQKIRFCGVPHHSAATYWLKLLKAGYKISIADQLEDPQATKGLVRRDIVRSLSPGCVYDLEGLEQDQANYLLAVFEQPTSGTWDLALADVSTGELRLGQVASMRELVPWIEKFRPKELLCRRFCTNQLTELLRSYQERYPLCYSEMPEAILQDSKAASEMFESVLGKIDPKQTGIEVLAGLFAYLAHRKASLAQFLALKPLSDPKTMPLDELVIRDLELFETSRTRRQRGSLYRLLNGCKTPMGARLLRWSLANPLLDLEEIASRQDAVAAWLARGDGFLSEMRTMLERIGDLERLSTRILVKNVRPGELARIRDGLHACSDLATLLPEAESAVLGDVRVALEGAEAATALLARSLMVNPGALGEGGGVFQAGYDHELDMQNSLSQNSESEVLRYQETLKEKTGISSLKVKSHQSFGLVIEVTKANLAKVPESFIRRQTMVSCERFVTLELKALDEKLASAKELSIGREKELYEELLEGLSREVEAIRNAAHAAGMIDLIACLTYLARSHDLVRARLDEDSGLVLQGARHLVVEHFVGRNHFVPNDVTLGPHMKQMLITGPNMAGKSTVMRLTAICVLLNQIGSFVPCSEATMPIFDRIFTRVGASDDLTQGLSTFMVEMSESAYILRNATRRSLVILDEVGRGTSTQDGLAIAAAILHQLVDKTDCWLMFATHYHELVPLAQELAKVTIMQTQVLEKNDGIVFTHLLVPGASGSSYGLEVAKLAGVPESVIVRARTYLQNPLGSELPAKPHLEPETQVARPRGFDLAERIDRIKINRITPVQALNLLHDLKNSLHEPVVRGLFEDRQS